MSNLTNKQIYIALAIFFVGLICVLIGFEVYHQRVQQRLLERQHSQNAAQIESIKVQSDRLSDQATKLSEESDALKRQVDDEHQAAEKLKQEFKQASALASGLQMSMPVKTTIAEYYLEQSRFPNHNADVGLSAPETFQDNSLKSLTVSSGGVITLTYDEKSGVEDGKIQLVPSVKTNQSIISWRCETSSYENIAKILPACVYLTHTGS